MGIFIIVIITVLSAMAIRLNIEQGKLEDTQQNNQVQQMPQPQMTGFKV